MGDAIGSRAWLWRANDRGYVTGHAVIPCVAGLAIAAAGVAPTGRTAPFIALGALAMLLAWRGWRVWRR